MSDATPSGNTLVIDTSHVERWAMLFDREAPKVTRQYLNLAMKNAATIVQQREYKEAPRGVTGNLVKSIKQFVTEQVAIVGPEHNVAAMSVETGSKPHMPPVSAITAWAESKGINPWALAHSIKKKGTKANPFVQRTFKGTKKEVISEFSVATYLISKSLASMKGL